ncbi:MAG: PspC domain-containing protein [Bdellovibrionales bacterium]|nr:PspC domain-containing protein [Bdellovibrionales bacterium]
MKAFYRSDDGAVAGVCKGLSEVLDIDLGLLRLGFAISCLFGGCGFFAYLALAFSLPRQDQLNTAYEAKILGVCSMIARKLDLDVGVVRFLAILSPLWSLGGSILVYILIKFLMSEPADDKYARDVN